MRSTRNCRNQHTLSYHRDIRKLEGGPSQAGKIRRESKVEAVAESEAGEGSPYRAGIEAFGR